LKIKTTVHIHYAKWGWEDEAQYVVSTYPMVDTASITYICKQDIEIEVPGEFDPRAQQIAALEKEKQKVMADYQKTVTEINDRISKLQALEYTA
jgi:hypothetical protein